MSGGVDSSVAAALLVQQGYDVVGATMKTFCYSGNEAPSKTCCGLDGITDARRVSDTLGIPHYVFDVEEDFTRDVIDDFGLRVRPWPHAKPVRALQLQHEVPGPHGTRSPLGL